MSRTTEGLGVRQSSAAFSRGFYRRPKAILIHALRTRKPSLVLGSGAGAHGVFLVVLAQTEIFNWPIRPIPLACPSHCRGVRPASEAPDDTSGVCCRTRGCRLGPTAMG